MWPHDWLCDPTGAAFFAQSYFGVFEMGDTVVHNPLIGAVTISARLPVPATIRLLRDNMVVAEAHDWKLEYIVHDMGAYRLEALLSIDGEERPWIFTNPIFVGPPSDVTLPAVPDFVQRGRAGRHLLHRWRARRCREAQARSCTFLATRRTFRCWCSCTADPGERGDRSLYKALGDRFARRRDRRRDSQLPADAAEPASGADRGCGRRVRLGVPQHRRTRRRRIAHLISAGTLRERIWSALLALDEKYLKKFDLPAHRDSRRHRHERRVRRRQARYISRRRRE